ncbi:hypothetical protein A2U01_0004147 [Trifolium medium]|uniref:Transmembrane protein n=1 Tax=Trifolium medium TaxID=97028 RepID=A0A392M960_9FABA|nr:hypothetical protein [Trifolium medium]
MKEEFISVGGGNGGGVQSFSARRCEKRGGGRSVAVLDKGLNLRRSRRPVEAMEGSFRWIRNYVVFLLCFCLYLFYFAACDLLVESQILVRYLGAAVCCYQLRFSR